MGVLGFSLLCKYIIYLLHACTFCVEKIALICGCGYAWGGAGWSRQVQLVGRAMPSLVPRHWLNA